MEHSNPGYLSKTTLTRYGEKLYHYDQVNLKLTILNMDYSLFKTISVPDVGDSYANIYYVSDSLFNVDDKIEYAINYYNSTDSIIVFNEDGLILLKCIGNLWDNPEEDFIFGVNPKFVIKNDDSTWVYTLPGKYEPTIKSDATLQTLKYGNGLLSISNGNTVDISSINTDEQKLSLRNDTIYLTNGGSVYIGTESTEVLNVAIEANGLSNSYPVPATETLSIKYQLPNNESSGTIELFNSSGQTVKKFDVNSNNGEVTIDISQYTAGNYYIKLLSQSGFSSTKKSIILK